MIYFAIFALLIWVPIVFYIFESLPGPKAVVFAFITAWLFLPTNAIVLSGIPDWSKMTATTFGVTLIACLKHSARFRSLRFAWYDLPVVVTCVSPLFSSVLNAQGVYDGLSASLEEVFRWGLPYLIGRLFLSDARGNYLLCLGIAVGGLVYAPLCLFEIRMSPVLKLWVYGFVERPDLDFSMRYGGFRPIVFLSFGLELGWWMCCASLACYNLWMSGAVRRLRGYPMSVLTIGILIVTVACKSTGAVVLILTGHLAFAISRRTKSTILVWALLAVPPLYCVCRPLGIWSGASMVSLSESVFGFERAQSLAFRFDQEEVLMASAMERPIFGWSRFGGFNPVGANGKSAVTDGFWIIIFGSSGYVGLAALNAMLILPTVLFMRRFRPREWLNADVAPTLTLTMILPLFMLDNLSNAMLNPIYALAMGAVSGYVPRRQAATRRGRAGHLSTALDDPMLGPHAAHLHAVQADRTVDEAADDDEAAALAAARDGFGEEAWALFGRAIESRQAAVDEAAGPERLDRLARTSTLFARFLAKLDYVQFAAEQREQASQIWQSLLRQQLLAAEVLPAYAANLNDLAWLLIKQVTAAEEHSARACTLAEEAVQLVPEAAAYWNTLGIAYYRRRDHYKAVRALSQSVTLDPDGGTAFDFYYLALANHALGYAKPSRDWLEHAESWSGRHPEQAEPLEPIRREVRQALKLPGRQQPA